MTANIFLQLEKTKKKKFQVSACVYKDLQNHSNILFMQIVEATDNLIIPIHLRGTKLKVFYLYQGKNIWVIKGLELANVTLHCL